MSGLPIDTGNADGDEADVFWTSIHNHNRMGRSHVDPVFAWQNAMEIATLDGDLRPLACILAKRGAKRPTILARWLVRRREA